MIGARCETGGKPRINLQSFWKSRIYRSAGNLLAWISILAFCAGAMVFAYFWSERREYARLDEVSVQQLDLYASGLESELGRYEYLPSILTLDEDVLSLLTARGGPRLREKVNKRLASLNVKAGSLAIFVLDTAGIVLASSNGYQNESFVGMNFSAKPYFADALQGGQARYFSAAPLSGAPEYYFGQPIRVNGSIVGVAAVKISLEPIESTWVASGSRSESDKLLVVDENDVIVISSIHDWKYKTMAKLTPHQHDRLVSLGRYPSRTIESLGMTLERKLAHGSYLVSLPAAGTTASQTQYVVQEKPVARPDWRLIALSNAAPVWANARYTAFGAGALSGFIGLLGMYLLQRRRAIANRLAAREALQRAHDELELRVEQRTAELRQANLELVQASKLAMLGQMSVSVTHEINQPLTALRALSYNSRLLLQRGSIEGLDKNLKSIADLTDRMGRITTQLKSFARKAPLTNKPVRLATAVENVLVVLDNRICSEEITLQIDLQESLRVFCDENRLEQVLLNLFGNALDAMKDTSGKTLSVRAWTAGQRVMVRVADSGPGIPREVLPRLFEPFFSTKPPGEGLGLGLVISSGIVHEFGGTLRAMNVEGGAAFEFDLKLVEEQNNA